MKKIFSVMMLFLVASISFALAAGTNGDNGNENPENQNLMTQARAQVMAGNYVGENGQMMKIQKNEQDRLRIQSGNVSAECSQECNMTQEMVQNQTRLYAKMSNGNNAEIKVMPDVASEKAMEKLQLKNCVESEGCSLELKEVGKGNQTRMAYEVQAKKEYKMLGIFKAMGKNKVNVDAESGEVISAKKPWWSFLAKEVEETEA